MTTSGPQTKHLLGFLLVLVLATSLLPAQQAQADQGIGTTQTAEPNPATVGQPVTFRVTVTNGPITQHVGLQDFLPSGMELVSATPSQGACGAGPHGMNGAECTLGDLPGGGSATVEVVATPTVPGSMTNIVVSGGESTPATRDTATISVNPAS